MGEYLEIGQKAIDFSLPNQDGKEIKLSDYKGKKVILYFYPKDNTKGCTTEACDFRDHIKTFTDKNAVILGVSKDSVKSHNNFATKYDLPFELLSDVELTVIEKYGVWQLKKNYGKEYMGIVRSTYVISEEGTIEQVYKNIRVKGHIDKIIEAL